MDFRYNDDVTIPARNIALPGKLSIPFQARSIIIFSHGSGSSRLSRRNKMVADYLHGRNIGTLLFDLLTAEEDIHPHNRFDIDLLTIRLIAATKWIETLPEAADCAIGYFGASTGAASALKAAAYLPDIGAVISRGGRPDMVMDILEKVTAPTLLIVGGMDYDVLELNKAAYIQLNCEKHLEVVPGASHLFEETGAMDKVAAFAASWFEKYLTAAKIK